MFFCGLGDPHAAIMNEGADGYLRTTLQPGQPQVPVKLEGHLSLACDSGLIATLTRPLDPNSVLPRGSPRRTPLGLLGLGDGSQSCTPGI